MLYMDMILLAKQNITIIWYRHSRNVIIENMNNILFAPEEQMLPINIMGAHLVKPTPYFYLQLISIEHTVLSGADAPRTSTMVMHFHKLDNASVKL